MNLFHSWRRLVELGLSLDSSGSLSRLGTIRRMVSGRQVTRVSGTRLLVDFNAGKLEPASKIWPRLKFLNPFDLRPCWVERFLLAVSLLLTDVSRRSLQAIGVATTLRSRLAVGTKVYLWNPYSMFHFAVAELNEVDEISIFTPEYPIPSRVKNVTGPKIIGSIYGLDEEMFVPLPVAHSFAREDSVLAIYLTKLEIEKDVWSGWAEHRQIRRIEDRLVAFGLEMSRRGVRTEFFLHYSDRSDAGLAALPAEAHELVNLGDSLRMLSSRQLSLSGASTIGFQLSSLGIPHAFVLTVGEGEQTPYVSWAKEQDTVLDVDASDDDWVACLTKCFPGVATGVLLDSRDW